MKIHVDGLPEGSYYWSEVKYPDDYSKISKLLTEVEAGKTSTEKAVNKKSNPDQGELVIYKTDENGKKYLSGAKFEVTAAEDIVVGGGYTLVKKATLSRQLQRTKTARQVSQNIFSKATATR